MKLQSEDWLEAVKLYIGKCECSIVLPVTVTNEAAIKWALAKESGTDPADWYLVFGARYGMETVFKVLADLRRNPETAEIATQAYTCITAINPILAAKAKPVYFDISPDTLSLDPNSVVLSDRTVALVMQNTFGIISPETGEQLRKLAHDAGALLVEDCAHCVGSLCPRLDGKGFAADVSFHSFGVEKLLPTSFGGAVWINPDLDATISHSLRVALNKLPAPAKFSNFAVATYRNQQRLYQHLPAKIAVPLKRRLERAGLFIPPIAEPEKHGSQAFAPALPNRQVAARIVAKLPEIDHIRATRAENVAKYLAAFSGKVHIPGAISAHDPLVRFPFFLEPRNDDGERAEELLSELHASGVYAGRWYRPALFPGTDQPELYNFDPTLASLPVTKRLIDTAVQLPTLTKPENCAKGIAFVEDFLARD